MRPGGSARAGFGGGIVPLAPDMARMHLLDAESGLVV
jgi:hypothetical protein